MFPTKKGGEPSYAQKTIGSATTDEASVSHLELLVSADGRDNSLNIKQDAAISRVKLANDELISLKTGARKGYLHIVSGNVQISVQSEPSPVTLRAGDAIGIFENDEINLKAESDLVALWFDLPK